MKKALFVAFGFMFCIAAPAFSQSYLDKQVQDVQVSDGAYKGDNIVKHGHCEGLR